MAGKAAVTYVGPPCSRGSHTIRYASTHNCVECQKAASQAWRISNKEAAKVTRRAWLAANPDKHRADSKRWWSRNKAAHRASALLWAKNNKARVTENSIRRRALKLSRIPLWADKVWLQHAYDVATEMTEKMREPFHVDHELPLRGRLVSGLHVYENLQVIPGSDNCSKSNSFQPQ